MGAKIYILLFLVFASSIVLISRKKPNFFLFWASMFLFFVRPIGLPGIGELNISYFLLTFLFIFDVRSLLRNENLKYWYLYLMILLIGFLNFLLTSYDHALLKETDILLESWGWIKKFLIVFMVATAITQYVKTENDLLKLKNAFLWCCFVFSFTASIAYFGIYDGVVIYGPGSLGDGLIQDFTRDTIYSEIYGISYSNLVFGVSALSIVFLPTMNWKSSKKYIYLILTSFAVIISLKRMAIVALLFALIYYLIIQKKRGKNTWLIFIPLFFVLAGTTYYELVLKRFSGLLNSINNTGVTDSSSNIRFSRLEYALKAFYEMPLIGKGAGYAVYVHNGFVEVLANFGLLGLLLFRPFLKILIKKSFSRFINDPWSVSLFIMLLTLVLMEAAINRVEIMYFLGMLTGGAIVTNNIKLSKIKNK